MSEYPQIDDELLSAYLDDELAPEERARVDERLAADPAARQLLDELRSVSRAMKELPGASLGTDLRDSVLRRAERAMLFPGELASASGKEKVTPVFPIGRSKRAWLWAGAALAAGLMLMIFQRDPARDAGLPKEVAQTERDSQLVRNEPLPSLEFRAVEQLADQQADVAAGDQKTPLESAGALAKESLADETSSVSLGRTMDRPLQPPATPTGGEFGGLAGVEFQAKDKSTKEIDAAKDLLVVHVNMKPEALRGRAFDNLLLKNEIQIEEAVEEPAQSPEMQDVEVVMVEAVPWQVYKCLDEIKKDESNYLGVAVDDRLANSQRTLAEGRSEADMKQYNRGIVPNQQQVELAPDNHYYFKAQPSQAESEQLARDAAGFGQMQVAEQPPAQTRNRFLAQGETTSAPAAASAAPTSTSGDAIDALSSDASGLATAANSQGDFYPGAKLNVARRAVQQLEAKADTLQVLFVLTCPTDHPAPAQAATATPTTAPTNSAAPAQEGLKSGER